MKNRRVRLRMICLVSTRPSNGGNQWLRIFLLTPSSEISLNFRIIFTSRYKQYEPMVTLCTIGSTPSLRVLDAKSVAKSKAFTAQRRRVLCHAERSSKTLSEANGEAYRL